MYRSAYRRDTLIIAFVKANPGCTIDEVHAGFPEYKRKTIKNILFDLDCDKFIRRTTEQPGLGPQISRAWPIEF